MRKLVLFSRRHSSAGGTAETAALPTVTFVLPGYGRRPSGGYRVVYTYATYLAASGWAVSIVHARPNAIRDAGRSVVITAVVRLYYASIRCRAPRWAHLPRSVRSRSFPRMRAQDVPQSDIYVATSVKTADFVASLCANRSARPVYLIQGYETYSDAQADVERTWRLPFVRIVVSRWLLDLAVRLGVSAHLVQNGVDLTRFSQGPPLEERPFSVLAMVATAHLKRTDLVVSLMRALYREHPDVRLATFGACKRPKGLPSSVRHFRSPSRRTLARLYQNSRIFVCTSDFEGFGLPVAEAMACGCAIVSTRNGGVESFAGDNVFYVECNSSGALIHGVSQLARDPEAANRLAAKSSKHAQTLNESCAAQAFARVLRETLSLACRAES